MVRTGDGLQEVLDMPYDKFICPDGIKVGIKECLDTCRLAGTSYAPCGRCLSKPTLQSISLQREWTGKPSTTQLLKGTREVYLELTNNYSINPRESLFMINGTRSHDYLEQFVTGDDLAEIRIDDGVSTGAFDYYSTEDGGTLYDYKLYGSFKVAKVLGLHEVKVPTGEVYKTGAKKGQPKFRKEFRPGVHSRLDLAIQLNDYRMKIEKELNKPVNKLVCEIIVRDGNTFIANSRGITQPGYLVPINKISDVWIERYMKKKANDLIKALETNTLPPPCRHSETWGGLKCERYCSVAEFCDVGRKAKENKS